MTRLTDLALVTLVAVALVCLWPFKFVVRDLEEP